MKNITILGSTGSIGIQTLDVVRHNREDFCVLAITGGKNIERMAEQICEFSPKYAVMKDEETAEELQDILRKKGIFQGGFAGASLGSTCEVLWGMEGFIQVSVLPEADVVVAAMVGMVGLRPVMEAISAGKDIALANKETLVTAGHIIMKLAKEKGVRILPVDSEHSAIFQALNGEKKEQAEVLYLTASGGPFRSYSKQELESVTKKQALAHPNWLMGPKITVDSATMINKGLEIIEATWLFDMDLEHVKVLVQPQSIIHSMVGFRDGAVMAQLGVPDMRLPIQYALYYPERVYLDGERLNFEKIGQIQFEKPNTDVLRGIPLAVEACRAGGSMLTVMNAANEYAVSKFLSEDIKFLEIYDIIEFAMRQHKNIDNPDLDEILQVEAETCERLKKKWNFA